MEQLNLFTIKTRFTFFSKAVQFKDNYFTNNYKLKKYVLYYLYS